MLNNLLSWSFLDSISAICKFRGHHVKVQKKKSYSDNCMDVHVSNTDTSNLNLDVCKCWLKSLCTDWWWTLIWCCHASYTAHEQLQKHSKKYRYFCKGYEQIREDSSLYVARVIHTSMYIYSICSETNLFFLKIKQDDLWNFRHNIFINVIFSSKIINNKGVRHPMFLIKKKTERNRRIFSSKNLYGFFTRTIV